MKGLKIQIKDDYADGFIRMVNDLLNKDEYKAEDEDKLMLAGLAEIKHRLCVKQLKPQKQYTLTLTPVQALSVRILFTGYVNETHTAMGNYLHGISNKVENLYQ